MRGFPAVGYANLGNIYNVNTLAVGSTTQDMLMPIVNCSAAGEGFITFDAILDARM